MNRINFWCRNDGFTRLHFDTETLWGSVFRNKPSLARELLLKTYNMEENSLYLKVRPWIKMKKLDTNGYLTLGIRW